MFSRCFIVIIFLGAVVFSGCETAKGFKQDVKNTVNNLKGQGSGDGWVQKTDQWIKDNMW